MANPHDPLETFVHQTLRSVPARRAPLSLEQRVLSQLARRAALPWYRQSFRHWPTSLRLAFLAGSAALAALTLALGFALYQRGVGPGLAHWTQQLKQQASAIKSLGELTLTFLPAHASWWLAGAAVALVAMSLCTVGLGAAAYRLLWKQS